MPSMRTILCILLFWTSVAAIRADDLVPTVEWARRTGVDKTLDPRLAKAFGFPEKELPIHQRAFRLTRDHWVFAVSDNTNRTDIIIFESTPAETTAWLTGENGLLRYTLKYSTNGVITVVPKDSVVEADFRKVKRFLIERAAREDE